MAFRFIKKYRGQFILASVVSGVWLGYQWIPETVGLGLPSYEKKLPEIESLGDASLSLIEQVKADLRAQGVSEKRLERCRFFKLYSWGWMYNCGTTRIRTGAFIGIPFVFEMKTIPQLVPHLKKVTSVDNTELNWNSDAGKQYIKNIFLSDNAKKYAIAWQLNKVNSFHLFGKSIIGISVLCLYFIQGQRAHMKYFTPENMSRAFERVQEASDKKLGYHRPLTDIDRHKFMRSYNIFLNARIGIAFIVLYHILYYSYRWYLDKSIDKKTGQLGEEYVQGGIEFYEKVLERNKAERELMDFGTSYYKENGDVIQGYVFSPYWPASKARDLLTKMLKNASS